MTDTHSGHSSHIEEAPLNSQQSRQAQNTLHEQDSVHANATQTELGSQAQAQKEAVKDQVDGATASGPKRTYESTAGRVQVGETGDLHDLAARRRSQ
ncbi:hypothetical protein F4825DRAFT_416660 [Nemania diffusa]|nr:hypothetical protein F4825DRAFT_416660 [Nemania diffusa]